MIAVGLLLAGAIAAAAIAGLVRVARSPEPVPFRFPTPVGHAGGAAGESG
ncbi:hypothetical protein KF840_22470 [bacterium]|nr:hypothetical protein [bacterium]